jgi:Uma2 family endonuclease
VATLVEPPVGQIALRPFSLEDYHWLIEHGFFHEDERVELIQGVLHQMSPKGLRHAACLTRGLRIFNAALSDRACVRAQDPITLPGSNSEPEPDLVVAQWREDDYATHHPLPEDVLLVIEIADSSLDYDRRVKVPLYAASGISEFWLVNLQEDKIEVYREPTSPAVGTPYYRQHQITSVQDTVTPTRFPDCAISVEDLLPPKRD